VVADVADVNGEVVGNGALDVNVPIVHVRRANIGIHAIDFARAWSCLEDNRVGVSKPIAAGGVRNSGEKSCLPRNWLGGIEISPGPVDWGESCATRANVRACSWMLPFSGSGVALPAL